MTLAGKVALVTGAGSGIGASAARLLARKGVQVGVLGKTEARLQATVTAVEQEGGEALALVADVAEPVQMEAAVHQIVEHWDRLDIVVANAGINGVWAPLEDLEPEEWDRTLRVNLTGTFLTIKYAVPYLKRQGGAVVITSSVNGTRNFSNTGATAYSSSKAGQVAFAKMAALELARDRVRVNVICPGAIDTRINETTNARHLDQARIPVEFPEGWHPLRGEPRTSDQVAQLILFLVSDAADHITGTEMWIDGGESLLKG
ncbi:MAG: SDR family oxidoreductase [Chloroflexota bacterium]|nr:SDR family oxidoreductase [Chloroflexota bacterium]